MSVRRIPDAMWYMLHVGAVFHGMRTSWAIACIVPICVQGICCCAGMRWAVLVSTCVKTIAIFN